LIESDLMQKIDNDVRWGSKMTGLFEAAVRIQTEF